MTPDYWQRIDELFHDALQLAPEQRTEFLTNACGTNTGLQQEVSKLIAAFEESGDFIEGPLMSRTIVDVIHDSTTSLTGARVGRYEIRSLIGSGGMGEVYLCHDATLDRPIALKFLPSQFTKQEAQVQRFEREARAASALNHPNIITIHEIGQDNGHHFIATEFVEGQTLRTRISAGPITTAEAVNIVRQIASGLAAAHSAGVVHRDIKPENVMLRPDGLVKLLDFGLAKPLPPTSTSTNLTSQSISLQTDPAALMGTLAYLSPEQVRGEKVDHRTDIFSLGVVFVELLTGSRPFKGDNATDICKSILESEPLLPDSVAPRLSTIVKRMLAKPVGSRYQQAGDLISDIAEFERPQKERPRRMVYVVGAIVAILFVSLIGFWVQRSRSRPASGAIFDSTAQKLTDFPGQELFPNLAPDGRSVIFSSRHEGTWDIYRQNIGERTFTNLTNTPSAFEQHPAFSPDGSSIAFRSNQDGGGIFVMASDGTNVKRLTSHGYNPSWSPDGSEVAIADDNVWDSEQRNTYPSASHLWAINVKTGQQRLVTDRDAVQPSWSPHGQRLAYWGEQKGGRRDIWTIAANGGEPMPVTDDEFIDWNPVWSREGDYLYFLSNRGGEMNLWRVSIDETTVRLLSSFEPATLPSNNAQQVNFARNADVVVYGQKISSENVWQIDFDASTGLVTGPASPLTQGLKRYANFSLSPDEQNFVYLTRGEPQQDLYVADLAGTLKQRLTDDAAQDVIPRWSPDGQWIAFISDRSGKYEIWKIRPNGSGLTQMTHEPGKEVIAPVWAPDGKRLLYQIRNVNSFIVDATRPGNEQTAERLQGEAPEGFLPWEWSPDGTQLIGWQPPLQSQNRGVVVYSFASHKYRRLTNIGSNPAWLSDSRRALLREGPDLYLLDTVDGKFEKIFSIPRPNLIGTHLLSRDNRRIFFTNVSSEADIWILAMK